MTSIIFHAHVDRKSSSRGSISRPDSHSILRFSWAFFWLEILSRFITKIRFKYMNFKLEWNCSIIFPGTFHREPKFHWKPLWFIYSWSIRDRDPVFVCPCLATSFPFSTTCIQIPTVDNVIVWSQTRYLQAYSCLRLQWTSNPYLIFKLSILIHKYFIYFLSLLYFIIPQ